MVASFGSIPHGELLKSVARRIVDRPVLHLIKMWLECPVEETDDRGRKTRTTEAKDTWRGILTTAGEFLHASVRVGMEEAQAGARPASSTSWGTRLVDVFGENRSGTPGIPAIEEEHQNAWSRKSMRWPPTRRHGRYQRAVGRVEPHATRLGEVLPSGSVSSRLGLWGEDFPLAHGEIESLQPSRGRGSLKAWQHDVRRVSGLRQLVSVSSGQLA